MNEQRLNEITECAGKVNLEKYDADFTYHSQLHIPELIAVVERLKEENQQLSRKVDENKRLEKRFEEIDLAIQELKNAFTPYEKERFDIRYSHTGIINGAVRAIKFLRHLND